ncbi:MAG: beta-lactamase family protein [Ignavibacteriaceae bacterium]|nr:beta-lactamase family protein [Ignavibacteriaceae bacterium]
MKSKFLFVLLLSALISSCSDKVTNNPESTKTDPIKSVIDKIGDSLTTKLKIVGHEDIDANVPGAVIAVWSDELNFSYIKSFGTSDIITKEPMKANNLFRIGSITKTFVITVFLQLVDEKKVSLDDKLSKFYPDFPRAGEVTLRQLCNMTSGIFNFWETQNFAVWINEHPLNSVTPWEAISWAKDVPFYFNPGTDFHYSNTNTYLLGLIIETLTGNKIEVEVKNRLIDKLHLTSTFFPTTLSFPSGLSYTKGYEVDGNVKGPRDATEFLDLSLAWAAGAMISNIYDLKIWIQACAGGTLLSSITQTERMKLVPFVAANMNYGLGIMEYKGFYGHGGDVFGYHTFIIHSPERKTTIAVMLNSTSNQIKAIQDIIDCYLSL